MTLAKEFKTQIESIGKGKEDMLQFLIEISGYTLSDIKLVHSRVQSKVTSRKCSIEERKLFNMLNRVVRRIKSVELGEINTRNHVDAFILKKLNK